MVVINGDLRIDAISVLVTGEGELDFRFVNQGVHLVVGQQRRQCDIDKRDQLSMMLPKNEIFGIFTKKGK